MEKYHLEDHPSRVWYIKANFSLFFIVKIFFISSPICASMPWGEKDRISSNVYQHILGRHRFDYGKIFLKKKIINLYDKYYF